MSEPNALCPECDAPVPLNAAMGPPALAAFVCSACGHRFGPGMDAYEAGNYDDHGSETPRETV